MTLGWSSATARSRQFLFGGLAFGFLLGFGLFSMLLAGPFILVQTNLKRLLAYSSLEHVGLICVGVGLNTPLTIFGALLHMGYHALTKPVRRPVKERNLSPVIASGPLAPDDPPL